jgi:hypothetical protein
MLLCRFFTFADDASLITETAILGAGCSGAADLAYLIQGLHVVRNQCQPIGILAAGNSAHVRFDHVSCRADARLAAACVA